MSERLRLVQEQILDAEQEIERLRSGAVQRAIIDQYTRLLFAGAVRALKKMLVDAPAVILANRERPLPALDAYIRERLTRLSEQKPPKVPRSRAKTRKRHGR